MTRFSSSFLLLCAFIDKRSKNINFTFFWFRTETLLLYHIKKQAQTSARSQFIAFRSLWMKANWVKKFLNTKFYLIYSVLFSFKSKIQNAISIAINQPGNRSKQVHRRGHYAAGQLSQNHCRWTGESVLLVVLA